MEEDIIYSPTFKKGYSSGLGLSKDNTFGLATENPVGNIDTSKYLNIGKDGLSDGIFSSIFGEDGYFGNLNKDLAGVGGFDGLGQIAGLGFKGFGALQNYENSKAARKDLKEERALKNKQFAMIEDRNNTFKADKNLLNAGYSGKTPAPASSTQVV